MYLNRLYQTFRILSSVGEDVSVAKYILETPANTYPLGSSCHCKSFIVCIYFACNLQPGNPNPTTYYIAERVLSVQIVTMSKPFHPRQNSPATILVEVAGVEPASTITFPHNTFTLFYYSLARRERLELPTYALEGRCSIQLS